MMGVRLFQRRGIWWVAIHTKGKRYRQSLEIRDRSRARIAAEEIRRGLMTGTLPAPFDGTPTVEDYARERLEAWERRLRETTLHGYRQGLAVLVRVLGNLRLGEVRRADALRLAEALRVGPGGERGAGTIRNLLAPAGSLFADALDAGIVRANPFALRARLVRQVARSDHRPLDETTARPVPYTREEQAKLLGAIADPADSVAVLLGLRAGLRRSEVLALRRRGVDLTARVLRVDRRLSRATIEAPKTPRSARAVPMSRELAAAVRKLIARQNERALKKGVPPPELLCPAKRKREADTYAQEENQFARRFARYLEAAGIERRGHNPFHRLRHTFATELLVRGVPILKVSLWLGHSSIEFTQRVYAYWIPDPDEHDAIDRLDDEAPSATIPPPSEAKA